MNLRSIAALATLLLVASPATAEILKPAFFVPAGEKKVGQYVWVWHTQKVQAGQIQTVEADCPIGYAVLGGGYHESTDYSVQGTMPNAALDGWDVEAAGGPRSYSPGNTVTVYASCAPAT